jgi:hypothetical protein
MVLSNCFGTGEKPIFAGELSKQSQCARGSRTRLNYEPTHSGGCLELPAEKFRGQHCPLEAEAKAAHEWLVEYWRSRLGRGEIAAE